MKEASLKLNYAMLEASLKINYAMLFMAYVGLVITSKFLNKAFENVVFFITKNIVLFMKI